MEDFREMIGRISAFVVCAQAIVHFRPREVYARYLRLLLGLMVLVQIFQPLWGLFFGKADGQFQDSLAYFQESMEQGMQGAVEKAAETEALLERSSLKQLQEQMEAAGEAEEVLQGQSSLKQLQEQAEGAGEVAEVLQGQSSLKQLQGQAEDTGEAQGVAPVEIEPIRVKPTDTSMEAPQPQTPETRQSEGFS